MWPWPLTLTFTLDLDIDNVYLHTKFGDPRSNGFWDMNELLVNFGPVTDRRTESDAYEPTVHKHRCAQKREPPRDNTLENKDPPHDNRLKTWDPLFCRPTPGHN